MSHLVSREPWGVADLDTVGGRILFQQDWFYTWTLFNSGVTPWNLHQKRYFHNTLDRQIWTPGRDNIRLRVSGATPFARRFAASGVPIHFDLRWVPRAGHYNVIVRKLPPEATPDTFISSVDFGARRIELDCADLAPFRPTSDAGDAYDAASTSAGGTGFAAISAAAASAVRLGRAVAILVDTDRIENVGRQVRPRHLHLIVDALNALTPGATWSMPIGTT